MPAVSVLMPIYKTNHAYLCEAIESILSQTYCDFEFLILNDSPDDVSLDKVIKSYDDKRIIYIKNDKNMGITPSRNKLIGMAKGDYLAVMDHDDISLPARFEKQVKYLDNNPNVGVVSCKVKLFSKCKTSRNPTKNEDIKMALFRSCSLTHPASMIRKSVLLENNIRYEKEFSPAEDYALWCRLIPFTNFYNIPEVLFRYREHDKSTTKIQSKKMTDATFAIHSFVRVNNPILYKEFLLKATHTTRIKLLGFIPFIKIITIGYRTNCYLFEKIPLWTSKKVIKLQEKN